MYVDGDAPKEMLDEISDDARILYFTGAKLWREKICPWMPNSEAEIGYIDEEGSGHIDRQSLSGNGETAIILDWKTGRKDISHKDQGFGYARRMFLKYPALEVSTVHFCWLRTQELESYVVSRARSDEWASSLASDVLDWDGVYHPGEHCSFCRRFSSCPALAEMQRASLTLVSSETVNLAAMDGPQLASTYRRLAPLAKQIESLQAAIKAEVGVRGGVDDGDGRRLYYKQVNGPRKIDTLKAWPVLSAMLTDNELAECVDVSISAVESAVAAKATGPRGAKKAAKEKLQDALAEAGAITQATINRFTDERITGNG
jgi:hypothetical protein